jgi:hypothetical protein
MTPPEVLIELLDRFAALQGDRVLISEAELSDWPAAAIVALKTQRLIKKSRPASSVVCPGCERECVMPVHCLTDVAHSIEHFIVCDKRSDTNRVMVDNKRLKQWQCNADAICRFVAESLKLRRSDQASEQANRWNIGVATGKKRSQMLCLQVDDFCMLTAGGNALPLADLVEFQDDVYSLNDEMISKMVDAVDTTDIRYTPSNPKREARKLDTQAMYESWQKEYRKLIKSKPNRSDVWYSQQIAKMEIAKGRDAETIRKHIESEVDKAT